MNPTIYNSEYIGIHWDESRLRWFAKIHINGESLFLGRFENEGDAIKMRKKAETALSLLNDMNAVNIHDASVKKLYKSIAGFISKDGFQYKVQFQVNSTGGDL